MSESPKSPGPIQVVFVCLGLLVILWFVVLVTSVWAHLVLRAAVAGWHAGAHR